jgi:acyl-CoA dehydrogenase
MTAVDPAVAEMMDDVFARFRDDHPPAVAAERNADLWQSLDQLGLVRLTGSEPHGGSGAGWVEAAELHAAAVRHAVRIPLAEHDLLACCLLEASGLLVDGAVRTVCVLDENDRSAAVPWAAGADRVVVAWRDGADYRLADVATQDLAITPGHNLIGEPRDTVSVDREAVASSPVPAALVLQLGLKSAMVRAVQLCAALDRIVELSVRHAAERTQFGRPLSKFQTVQNLVSDIAAEAALARAATEGALAAAVASDWSAANLDLLVAVARSCAGHAASVVVRNAHQVHGAIGTTREHRLHEFTRAALAWRSEFGSVRYWDGLVTNAALQAGAPRLWGLLTG